MALIDYVYNDRHPFSPAELKLQWRTPYNDKKFPTPTSKPTDIESPNAVPHLLSHGQQGDTPGENGDAWLSEGPYLAANWL